MKIRLVGSVRFEDGVGVGHDVNDRWCGHGEVEVDLAATASYIVEVMEPGDVAVARETVDTEEEHLTDAAGAAVLMVEDSSHDLQREDNSRWLVYCRRCADEHRRDRLRRKEWRSGKTNSTDDGYDDRSDICF